MKNPRTQDPNRRRSSPDVDPSQIRRHVWFTFRQAIDRLESVSKNLRSSVDGPAWDCRQDNEEFLAAAWAGIECLHQALLAHTVYGVCPDGYFNRTDKVKLNACV